MRYRCAKATIETAKIWLGDQEETRQHRNRNLRRSIQKLCLELCPEAYHRFSGNLLCYDAAQHPGSGVYFLLGFHPKESNYEAIIFLLRRFLLQ